jgi:hypothetical protein
VFVRSLRSSSLSLRCHDDGGSKRFPIQRKTRTHIESTFGSIESSIGSAAAPDTRTGRGCEALFIKNVLLEKRSLLFQSINIFYEL